MCSIAHKNVRIHGITQNGVKGKERKVKKKNKGKLFEVSNVLRFRLSFRFSAQPSATR